MYAGSVLVYGQRGLDINSTVRGGSGYGLNNFHTLCTLLVAEFSLHRVDADEVFFS